MIISFAAVLASFYDIFWLSHDQQHCKLWRQQAPAALTSKDAVGAEVYSDEARGTSRVHRHRRAVNVVEIRQAIGQDAVGGSCRYNRIDNRFEDDCKSAAKMC